VIKHRVSCLSLSILLLTGQSVVAETRPVVVELFTSQGCYSCPPADHLLGELSAQPDIVALEFHVDYWDGLVYGSAGKWKDPFSDAGYTRRQQSYNSQDLGGRIGVYTPQMIIGGNYAVVGSNRSAVLTRLEAIRSDESMQLRVDATQDGKSLTVSVSGGDRHIDAGVWLVRLDRQHLTAVPNGENNGKTLTNHNVVRAMTRIGDWKGADMQMQIDDFQLGPNQHCAILVQTTDPLGPIIGAARCPES